jgi:hypothetical protein
MFVRDYLDGKLGTFAARDEPHLGIEDNVVVAFDVGRGRWPRETPIVGRVDGQFSFDRFANEKFGILLLE